jgi:phosphatidyl-myo-inositol alpha-mannosyltransferase
MRVGIVCPYDWSYPGGVRTHIIGLRRALEALGHSTVVIAPATHPEEGIFRAGGSFGIPMNGSVARICFTPGAASRIRSRLAEGDIDVLHVHEPAIPSVSLLALMRSDLPVVGTFHASAPKSLGYAIASPILTKFVSRLKVRIAVSEAGRGFVSRYFPGEYRLIPNGVEVRRYREAKPDESLLSTKPFVLFVGRPEKRKGFDMMLAAMEGLRKSTDVRLVAAGIEAGPALPEWVTCLGHIPEDRLPSVYKAADVFCAPSLGGESFGIVIAEAMAAGVPVVCSGIPGYLEASAGAAQTSPAGDPDALASSLQTVLSDQTLRASLVQRGARRAAELDWDVLAKDVADAYLSVL